MTRMWCTWAVAPVTESVRAGRAVFAYVCGRVAPVRWCTWVCGRCVQLFVCVQVCFLAAWGARMLYALVCIGLFNLLEYVEANADKASVVAVVAGRGV